MNIYKKSVITKWLRSYLIIITIIILFCSIAYYKSYELMKNQAETTYLLALRQMEGIVEEKLREVYNQSVQINFNQRSNSLMSGIDNKSIKRLTDFNIIKDLNSINLANDFIDEIAVYYSKVDYVLTSQSKYTFEDFYSYNPIFEDYKKLYDFKEFITNKHESKILVVNNKQIDMKYIYWIQTLPLQKPNEKKATVIMKLNTDSLNTYLENMHLLDSGSIAITDHMGTELFSNFEKDYYSMIKKDIPNKDKGVFYKTVDGEKLAISYIKSDKLVYIFFSKPILNSLYLKYYIRLVIQFIIPAIIIGVIAAYIFSKKNYTPLENMLTLLPDEESDDDVYQYIENELSKLIHIKKHYKANEVTLKKSLFYRLITEESINDHIINEMREAFGVEFNHSHYMIILFDMEESEFEDVDMDYFIVNNLFSEIMQPIGHFYLFNMDSKRYVGILNFASDNIDDIERIEKKSIIGVKFLQEKMNIHLTLSISSITDNINQLHLLYNQAQLAMEYKIYKGKNEIILYTKLNMNKEEISHYNQLFLHCSQVNHYLEVRKYNEARKQINKIFDTLLMTNTMHDKIKYRMYSTIDMLHEILTKANEVHKKMYLISHDIIDKLYECETLIELKNQVVAIMDKLEIESSDYFEKRNNTLISNVINYIKGNYCDNNLSVSSIADNFEINISQLSRFFKQEKGVNLLSYIHQYRINEAKKLLSHGLSVGEVGEKVGYCNDITFIRVFKKYEGITPGKYKE